MALTSTEEALVRQLLDQQAAILSLAGNEATITSKLGATKVTLSDLPAASTIEDTDLFLTRQGLSDKSVTGTLIRTKLSRFQQEGAGSILRDTQDKLREIWLTPEDFGGLGDGASNDATAIQEALDTGKNVRIPDGNTYVINTPILLKASNQVLKIDGVLKAGAVMDFVVESTNFDHVGVIGSGSIDCNLMAKTGIHFSANQPAVTGIYCRDIVVKNAAGPWSGFTAGILFDSVGGKAGGNRHKDVMVHDVTVKGCLDHGLLIAYADGVSVQNNLFDDIGFHGHESVNCTDVVISGNIAQNCDISGLGVGDNSSNWSITGNIVRNCGGDGSITCEHNSILGVISNNTIYDANTQGINVSFGTPGAAPFEKIRDIIVSNNTVFLNPSVSTKKTGINVYSSTAPGVGEGIHIKGNVIHGFNIGITYAYCNDGSISDNTILNLSGTESALIRATMVTRIDICRNHCNSDTGDHAIQLLNYAGIISERVNISDNSILASGSATKSLVYIEGTGTHKVVGNHTQGSLHYVECAGASLVIVGDNYGNLASTSFSGGTQHSIVGSANSTTVGASGGASALPAAPLGYATIFVPNIGQVKIPYYNI